MGTQVARAALLGAVALGAAACIEWDRSTRSEVTQITRYISRVESATGVVASLQSGDAPTGSGGPAVQTVLPSFILLGGTTQLALTAATPFSRVIVAVDGVQGYYELQLPSAVTSAVILVVYSQEIPGGNLPLRVGAGAGSGGVGAYALGNPGVIRVGTGDVQVNITWNSPADVDLYVVDPNNEEIFYGDRTSGSGGQLDLDSNAACSTDGPRAENIFWSTGTVPPRGLYTIRVNLWSACGATSTDFVVTVRTRNGVAETYTGRLTGPGNGGARGAGQRLADFNY
jgi:hypothetical protein